MEQLLAHLVGDYILQTHWMAVNKVKKTWVALTHAAYYTVPFFFVTTSIYALSIICVTHAIIDRFSIAKYVTMYKNDHYADNGYPKETPIWLSTWLIIILDNTIHLCLNYFAIKYL
jgi:hypothetical protein